MLFAALVAGLLMSLVLALLGCSFQTNDDPQLAMIAAGQGIALSPDEHLVFSNVLIGHALKALYTAAPAIAWYGCYLVLVQYLAQMGMLYCAISGGYSRGRVLLFALYFMTVGVFYLNNLQYTTTACLAGQTGILLCFTALQGNSRGPRQALVFAAGIAGLVVSALVRLECFLLMILLALPATLFLLRPASWRKRCETGMAAATCLLVVWGCAAYNDTYYARDPNWREFFQYNSARVKFNDYGWTYFTPETASIFANVGWSANDHALIADWFYDDPEVFSEAHLREVLSSYPWQWKRLSAGYFGRCAQAMLVDKSLWPVLLAMPIAIWQLGRGRAQRWALAATGLTAALLLTTVMVFNKPPPSRVYFPVLTFCLALAVVLAEPRRIAWGSRWPRLSVRCFCAPWLWQRAGARRLLQPTFVHALILLAVIGGVMAGHRQYRRSLRVAGIRREVASCLASLATSDPRLIVSWATMFPYEAISPFDNLSSLSNLHVLMMSWPQRTPIALAMKAHFHIDNLAQALCERPDIVLLGEAAPLARLGQFLKEHRGVAMKFEASRRGRAPFDLAGRLRTVNAEWQQTSRGGDGARR